MSHHDNLYDKVCSLAEAMERCAAWQEAGAKVVFTNGCFDILHRGHVEYLSQAADRGDRLVIGLNSDDSVRRQNKGPERPLNHQEARAMVLAGLGFVDMLVAFDDDTPLSLVNNLKPNVLVKGGDYDANVTDENHPRYIVGSAETLRNGGEVSVIPFVDGYSTTSLVNRMKD